MCIGASGRGGWAASWAAHAYALTSVGVGGQRLELVVEAAVDLHLASELRIERGSRRARYSGAAAVWAGSCSEGERGQVACAARSAPAAPVACACPGGVLFNLYFSTRRAQHNGPPRAHPWECTFHNLSSFHSADPHLCQAVALVGVHPVCLDVLAVLDEALALQEGEGGWGVRIRSRMVYGTQH